MVFLAHSIVPGIPYLNNQYIDIIASALFNGGTGVSIFFVLSGFLITYLIIDEYDRNNSFNIINFYMRRVLRIWPLYFAVLFFGFFIFPNLLIISGEINLSESNYLYYISFLSNFESIRIHSSNLTYVLSQDITWSVAIEEQFYLFWPLIFLFSQKSWKYILVIVIVLSIIFRIYNPDSIVLYFHTFSVLIDLAIGGFFAYLIKSNSNFRLLFEKTNKTAHIFIFISIFALLMSGSQWLIPYYDYALNRVLMSFLFAVLIASQALTTNKSFVNLGNFKFAEYWGKYTYGIYLLHPISIKALSVILNYLKMPKSFEYYFIITLIGFPLTLLISYISYNMYENKFIQLKNKFK